MKKILTVLAFLYAISPLYAQLIEGNPCTATCIDPSGKITGRQPNQDNVSPNQNLPCGSGTSEDNPTWWIIRPSGNSLTFTVTTANCVAGGCGLGVQMTLWEGDACSIVTAVDCVVGTSGTFTATVTPCKVYYLQIDGLCECQCNVTLTYDKNQILKTVPKPEFTGYKTACIGTTIKLCATIPGLLGCRPDGYTWRVEPAGSATISAISGETDCANVKINSVPTGGKIKICAKPKFNGKCPPTVQENCYEIDVVNSTFVIAANSNTPVCEGKTAMLEASGGTSYKWSGPDNFNSTLANPTIPNVQAKNAGLYSVEVTNADNCKGTTTTNLVVENCISSNDITDKNVQIYPNPFSHQLNIDADEIMDKIMIYNTLGQVIIEQRSQSSKVSIDVSTLPSAHYNLKINWANGKNSEYRVMKQ